MRFLFRVFAWVALLCGLVVAGWEAFTQHRLPETTREVRFLGFGRTPAECVARASDHFDTLEPEISEIARYLAADGTLASLELLPFDDADPSLLRFNGETRTVEELDGLITFEREEVDDLPDAERQRLRRQLEAVRELKSPYRIRNFWRPKPDHAVIADTFGVVCGETLQEWLWLWGLPLSSRPVLGDPHASLRFEYGEWEEELPDCLDGVPELDEKFTGVCRTEIRDGWYVRQEWIDYCAQVNAMGWPKPGDPLGGYTEEEFARFERLDAEGVTPCDEFGWI